MTVVAYFPLLMIVGAVLLLLVGSWVVLRHGFKEQGQQQHDRLSDHVPWGALVAPGIVLNKNRTLMRTLSFRGPDLTASSDEELMVITARVNNALKRLGSGWSYFVEAQRFACHDYPESRWPNRLSWLVDQERKAQFDAVDAHFESAYYLNLVWERPQPLSKRLENLFYEKSEEPQLQERFVRDLEYFQRSTADVFAVLTAVFPYVEWLDDDALLSYLHGTLSTHAHPVKAPDLPMYLDAWLPDQSFQAGEVAILGDHYHPTLSITGFPQSTAPGVLDALNALAIEYRWVTRFICMDRGEAQQHLLKKRRYWAGKVKSIWIMLKETASGEQSRLVNSDAQNKSDDADVAAQELGMDLVAYGQYTATLTVHDKHLPTALEKLYEVRKVLNAHGFVVKDEHLYAFEAWKGSLPGEIQANVRRPLINTINLAHLLPLSAVWAGAAQNAHLQQVCGVGDPHVVCSTSGATPFRLNLNVDDTGHTLILGRTGAGKSTLLGILALQWLKYPKAQVIMFDKDRSARALTMAMQGRYYEPGHAHAGLAFQPLANIHQMQERLWALDFLAELLRLQDVKLTPALSHELEQALQTLKGAPKEQRTFTGLQALCQNAQLRDALQLYTLAGSYGALFDADEDGLKEHPWLLFEMGTVMSMGERVVVPVLRYLFHRIEQRLDGRPTLLVLDESWLFLQNAQFAAQLQNWLKTLRKKNVYVVFATQEPADAAASAIHATIMSACATQIFLPDAEALSPELQKAYRQFGLTQTELQLLAQAQPKRDYYYRSRLGRRLFSLDMDALALALTGFNQPMHQQYLDVLAKNVAPAHRAALILKQQKLDWAVALLRSPVKEAA